MKRINIHEIAKALAETGEDRTIKSAEKDIKFVLECISNAVANGDKVALSNFGIFTKYQLKSGKNKAKFTASKAFSDKVNA